MREVRWAHQRYASPLALASFGGYVLPLRIPQTGSTGLTWPRSHPKIGKYEPRNPICRRPEEGDRFLRRRGFVALAKDGFAKGCLELRLA
jgi:hypothetical protein